MNFYRYHCTVRRVVDGDTLDLDIDLGLRVHTHARIRLLNIDTPETYGVKHDSAEWQAGIEAKALVEDWVFTNSEEPLVLQTHKDRTGKYGRWLGELLSADGESLNTYLRELGYGT